LVAEGRIAAREVEKALKKRDRLIREIRERMAALGVEGARVGGRLASRAAKSLRSAEKRTRKDRRRAVSAATKAARRAQGQYMAAVRRLSKDVRKRVLEIRKTKGVRAAIAAAKRLAK
jgi:signal transduction histidine kinase